MKAFHVCFEGPSGSGKSTQARILVSRLNDAGLKAVYIKSPNGTNFGKKVMEAILTECPNKLAEILAFSACFCQTLNEQIIPNLDRGVCVVSDRGIGSAYAHALYRCQGVIGDGLFEQIMSQVIGVGRAPIDLTFLMDLSVERCVARKATSDDRSRLDVFDEAGLLEALSYRDLFMKFPHLNWRLINSEFGVDKVSELVWAQMQKLIGGCHG